MHFFLRLSPLFVVSFVAFGAVAVAAAVISQSFCMRFL